MVSNLRKPIMRANISTAVFLITLGFLTAIGEELGSPGRASADTGSGDRLGCGTYCQSAGGYGGAPGGQWAVTSVSKGTVTPDADGYVPVTLKCNVPVPCNGALLLELPGFKQDARSDLQVDGGATRTIGVPLPRSMLAYIRAYGATTFRVSGDVMKVPPCNQIPQLAAACAKYTHSPDYYPGDGDGIIRYVTGKLTVKPRQ